MYKAVRGSGNLPESAKAGCMAFGLHIPDSGTGLDELELMWSLWFKMAGGLSMDEERARNWPNSITPRIPDDDDDDVQGPEEVPAEPDLEAVFNGNALPPTRQPVCRQVAQRAYLDSGSEDEFDI